MNAERVSEHIVSWLKNYAINAKVNGFVIGISGGIDSAVTSKLCAKTGLKLICVEMPIHQAESQVSRALEHINNLKNDFNNKSVLDMGCGTGVLAILAEMKGANSLDAIDYDNWCYLNSLENVERNNCKNITVVEGDASALKNKHYDIIIANINRNILLNDMTAYAKCLNTNGVLFLSGFYNDDIPIIEEECNKHGLKHVETLEKNHWVALKFVN